MLPIKTTVDDIDAICAYLKTHVGWVPIDKAKKTIDPKVLDGRKLEAYRRLGFVERDGTNIKLSQRGRAYATATDDSGRQAALAEGLRDVQLYVDTLEWIHHSHINEPSKTTVGNHWYDNFQGQLEGRKTRH